MVYTLVHTLCMQTIPKSKNTPNTYLLWNMLHNQQTSGLYVVYCIIQTSRQSLIEWCNKRRKTLKFAGCAACWNWCSMVSRTDTVVTIVCCCFFCCVNWHFLEFQSPKLSAKCAYVIGENQSRVFLYWACTWFYLFGGYKSKAICIKFWHFCSVNTQHLLLQIEWQWHHALVSPNHIWNIILEYWY